ncbi:MAG: TetR family transcriptional regulator [Sphingomonadales bacterium 35-56-22]|jgi:AcrR family transcriptional regulator|nr:TetR family transcriptional regulator [Sphingorhabdus sp.]OYY15987.1 MAG: TetR family transcriptional regulator [Sphingomonadales bacterium 35-56-22]OYY97559.1 MAG: TetR family transcriptional regulator [Sphingomonadales bacterium 28-56-43]OYZ61074.1 MAG: TetR family transcriptional regulator [Sphingomonadales bacterium 24-56-14]OZA82559.1 MAG: TetR family transcriptional regulator [Sphingomonadales bacterium 39-57-19]HQS12708.1 TetR family transcriptional regulator [Sphingorhabdus sp.]
MATTGPKLVNEAGDNAKARDQLIEAASQIMREGDTIDLSLSELSLRAGLNSALVKYYFGNKNGLMLALLDRDMGNIVFSLGALLAKDIPPEDKLRIHIGAVIDTYYAFPYLNRLLMRMVRDSAPVEAARIADLYLKPISKVYDALIAEGVKAGKFRKLDPQFFYFTVTGAADRFYSSRLVLRHCYNQDDFNENMRDAYREHSIDLIMRGLLV